MPAQSKILPTQVSQFSRWLNEPRFRTIRNVLLGYFVFRWVLWLLVSVYDRGLLLFLREQKKNFLVSFFRLVRPLYQSQINKETNETVTKIQKEFAIKANVQDYKSLPPKGVDQSQILDELKALTQEREENWKLGKASGAVYSGADNLANLSTEAYRLFCWSNPLHPDLFPGLRKIEAEVVSMVLRMYNASPEGCGAVSSGGTESILLAIKAARDYGRAELGITAPEMVVPVTAHAAFDKGATYFGVHIIHVPVDPVTGKVQIAQVKRVVTRNTVLIVGSAPSFPHGIIDDVEELAKIARRAKRPLHVDCCLGGFLLPFMEKAGYPLPPFDFRVDGVTSISCDTHKYGFAPKGSSVIMYASKELRKYQYFVQADWPGGIYASPTLSGSRPGALVAGCWATMVNMGEEGYINSTRDIISTARKIEAEVKKIPGLFVFGQPLVSVVGIGAKGFNVFALNDELGKKGWHLNPLQFPASIHICVTHMTVRVVDEFLQDLREAAGLLLSQPPSKPSGTAAIYGLAQALPDRSIVDHMSRCYLDALYLP